MKNLKFLFTFIILGIFGTPSSGQNENSQFKGAWRSNEGVIIFSDNFFSYALFIKDSKEFKGTYGGAWSVDNNMLIQSLEFNTFDNSLVGQSFPKKFQFKEKNLLIDNESYDRIDEGNPGKLEGAWLFSGRKQDGELTIRDTSQPRKTMKILSGSRFQWIAYNVETGGFSGTGGGTYTTIDNQYTENIDFFSRDSSRIGATLSFNYEIIEGIWHHSGLNSRGESLYELWSPR